MENPKIGKPSPPPSLMMKLTDSNSPIFFIMGETEVMKNGNRGRNTNQYKSLSMGKITAAGQAGAIWEDAYSRTGGIFIRDNASLNHNEYAVSRAVSRMKMPPVREYASSLVRSAIHTVWCCKIKATVSSQWDWLGLPCLVQLLT